MKKYLIGVAVVILVVIGVLVAIAGGKNDPVAVVPTSGGYVALGDSVAAGVGLKTESDPSACNRTDQSYPHLVAVDLHYKLINLACSGATLPAGIIGQQEVNKLIIKPQLDQLFASPKPQLISLTIGANDADWTAVFAKCYTGVCGSVEDTAAVKQRLGVVGSNLQKVLTQIQQHYGAHVPSMVVTGYHQVFPTSVVSASCSDLVGVDATELTWGRQQQVAIGETIKSTVEASAKKYSFARYAAIDFSGHELCSADPWVQGLADKQPYHPTEAGQAAFAKQVKAYK